MSVSYWMYRGPVGAGPMHTWETNLSLPLGSAEHVKSCITEVFPETKWQTSSISSNTWFAHTLPEFQISTEDDGLVHLISISRAWPDEVLKLASEMQLSVFDPQTGGEFEPNYSLKRTAADRLR